MKKRGWVLILCLAGCGEELPEDAEDASALAVTPGSSYSLVRKGSGKCLSGSEAVLQPASCSGAESQIFRVENVGSGRVRLVHAATSKCVDVYGAGTSDGTRVQLWPCNGTRAQSFTLQDIDGWARLRNPNSSKCVADLGSMQIASCNRMDAQLWRLTPASAPPPPPPDAGVDASGATLTWRKANLTHFTSYPDPGSEECVKYNGCMWAGYFAFVSGKQPESWVMSHNIAAVHSKDAPTYKLKTLRLRQGTRQIDVTVYDMCADSDCSGCCTENSKETGFLIDIEKYTMQRFGSGDGIVDWACLDCN